MYQARLTRLREILAQNGLDGLLVPRADEHLGEYVPQNAERLAWLTGFTGSAGLAVVLADHAAVFTDGRYVLQLAAQTDPDLWQRRHFTEEPAPGWQISADGPYSVALDLHIDRDLRLEGTARELVRLINDLRKRRGLDLTDRIALTIAPVADADGEIAAMLAAHGDAIAREVLAHTITCDTITWDTATSDAGAAAVPATGERFTIGRATVQVLVTVPR